jgi:hypothetical protein
MGDRQSRSVLDPFGHLNTINRYDLSVACCSAGGCTLPAQKSGKKVVGRTAQKGHQEFCLTGCTDADPQNHLDALDATCGRRVQTQTQPQDLLPESLLSGASGDSGSCDDSSSPPLQNLQMVEGPSRLLLGTEAFGHSCSDSFESSSRANRNASPSFRLAGGMKSAAQDQTPE